MPRSRMVCVRACLGRLIGTCLLGHERRPRRSHSSCLQSISDACLPPGSPRRTSSVAPLLRHTVCLPFALVAGLPVGHVDQGTALFEPPVVFVDLGHGVLRVRERAGAGGGGEQHGTRARVSALRHLWHNVSTRHRAGPRADWPGSGRSGRRQLDVQHGVARWQVSLAPEGPEGQVPTGARMHGNSGCAQQFGPSAYKRPAACHVHTYWDLPSPIGQRSSGFCTARAVHCGTRVSPARGMLPRATHRHVRTTRRDGRQEACCPAHRHVSLRHAACCPRYPPARL